MQGLLQLASDSGNFMLCQLCLCLRSITVWAADEALCRELSALVGSFPRYPFASPLKLPPQRGFTVGFSQSLQSPTCRSARCACVLVWTAVDSLAARYVVIIYIYITTQHKSSVPIFGVVVKDTFSVVGSIQQAYSDLYLPCSCWQIHFFRTCSEPKLIEVLAATSPGPKGPGLQPLKPPREGFWLSASWLAHSAHPGFSKVCGIFEVQACFQHSECYGSCPQA